jgi:hypothetical protein
MLPSRDGLFLADFKHLDVEDEGGVGWNARELLAAVGQMCGNCYAPLAACLHALHANLPALDDLLSTELEAEWLALLIAVEDAVVGLQLADVAHAHPVAILGRLTRAELFVVERDALDALDAESRSFGFVIGFGIFGWGWGGALLEVFGEGDLLVGLVGR